MRNCPLCAQDIQDEAIYCRHCRSEVEPAMWLEAMRKCPYCAEWIQRELDRCNYCDRDLYPQAVEQTAPFVDTNLSDFVSDLREEVEPAVEPPALEPELAERDAYPAALPAPQSPEPQSSNLLRSAKTSTGRLAAAPDEDPSSFGAQPLRELTLLGGDDGTAEQRDEEPGPPRPKLEIPGWLPRLLLTIVLLAGLGGGGYALLREPASRLLAQIAATDIPPSATAIPQPTSTLRQAPTLPPATATNLSPTGEVTEVAVTDCLRWDQIVAEDEGQELCGYGLVKRWFAVEEIPFVAIFSETAGTFAIVDRTQAHPEVGPGTCIRGRGVVEIMRGTRPNIDVQGKLEFCEQG